MKLITWNLAGRIKRAAEQVRFIESRGADVVALQEVTVRTRSLLRPRLSEIGLQHQIDTFDRPPAQAGPRRYGVLIASKLPINALNTDNLLTWPERMLSVVLKTKNGDIEIHATHVPPGSSNGWIKIDTLRGIFDLLAVASERPRILCGDFNTPKEEWPDGTIVTWGQTVRRDGTVAGRKRIRGRDGADWDRGERDVLVGLREFDLGDVFRDLHGYDEIGNDWTWIPYGTKRNNKPRRFDHVCASKRLHAESFRYLHEPRKAGLSDHAAAEVIFGWPD